MTHWLVVLAWCSLALALVCCLAIAVDLLAGHRQHMMVMNFVWPITALYSGPIGLVAYFWLGRPMSHSAMMKMQQAKQQGHPMPMQKSFAATVGIAASHCGAGCTLGDICAETLVAALGLSLLGHAMYAAWIVDYILAYILGIVFQYFSIVPMRHLKPGQGIIAAIKADTLSLTAWQLGMYGWMAIAMFALFHQELPKSSPVFWFMMQIAMLAGFATAYPVNWWLVKSGIKEKM